MSLLTWLRSATYFNRRCVLTLHASGSFIKLCKGCNVYAGTKKQSKMLIA